TNVCKTVATALYILYILAELHLSLLVKRLHFNRVIPTTTFCWGLVCPCMHWLPAELRRLSYHPHLVGFL
ncbi:hypothetical protein BDU57DRAFT_571209, partial [Ampelomyces quisqualis]